MKGSKMDSEALLISYHLVRWFLTFFVMVKAVKALRRFGVLGIWLGLELGLRVNAFY